MRKWGGGGGVSFKPRNYSREGKETVVAVPIPHLALAKEKNQ